MSVNACGQGEECGGISIKVNFNAACGAATMGAIFVFRRMHPCAQTRV